MTAVVPRTTEIRGALSGQAWAAWSLAQAVGWWMRRTIPLTYSAIGME
jgi:hypothetical protein